MMCTAYVSVTKPASEEASFKDTTIRKFFYRRTPKLLPCQHTFCLEPCMENLVDHVHRSVKCPECRAEHQIPYDGVKAFQTNFTMVGFLEIHLQATETNTEEMEAYIRR